MVNLREDVSECIQDIGGIPCLTLEFVAIGLDMYRLDVEAEGFLDGVGRFLKFSRGSAILVWVSINREELAIGPAFGCLLLNWEKRE